MSVSATAATSNTAVQMPVNSSVVRSSAVQTLYGPWVTFALVVYLCNQHHHLDLRTLQLRLAVATYMSWLKEAELTFGVMEGYNELTRMCLSAMYGRRSLICRLLRRLLEGARVRCKARSRGL